MQNIWSRMSNYDNREICSFKKFGITDTRRYTCAIIYQEHIIFSESSISPTLIFRTRILESRIYKSSMLCLAFFLPAICQLALAIFLLCRALQPCVSKLNDPSHFIIECRKRQSLWNIHDVHYNLS